MRMIINILVTNDKAAPPYVVPRTFTVLVHVAGSQQPKTHPHPPIPAARLFFVFLCFSRVIVLFAYVVFVMFVSLYTKLKKTSTI